MKQPFSWDFALAGWRPYAWLVLLTLGVYGHVVRYSEYTYFDDYILIQQSFSHIDELSDIPHSFLDDAGHAGQGGNLYRPILTITFILSAQLSGEQLWGYHLTDLLLHIIACCLLFLTLNGLGTSRGKSFALTLLFCLHPVLTQSIAWTSGRNDSLLAIFILPGFLTFHKYFQSGSLKWGLLHLLFFFLALFTKETAVALPLLVLGSMLLFRRERLISLQTLLLIVGWGMIVLNWRMMRYLAAIYPIASLETAGTVIFSNLWMALFFLGKIFWPFSLAFAPVPPDMPLTAGVGSALFLLFLIVLSPEKDWRSILFGLAWFLLFLAPALFYHSVPPYLPKFYEHRIYVPFIGIVILLASLSLPKKVLLPQPFLGGSVVVLALFLAVMSFRHSRHFQDSITLREYALSTSPHDLHLQNSIQRMLLPESLSEKLAAYQRPNPGERGINPHYPLQVEDLIDLQQKLEAEKGSGEENREVLQSLGALYFARGLFVRAVATFHEALELLPASAEVQYNLGVLYFDAHRKDDAERSFLRALEFNPRLSQAHGNLCYLYFEQKRFEEAMKHCEQAQQLGASVPLQLVEALKNSVKRK
ncbi:MAG: tetratricopeptide repeat protein [Ignavibacteriales bacterium]|nr:tetratricopeptide repeat protein [Ignavibacteriales bacterium]